MLSEPTSRFETGFTLIELVIAMTLLAVVIAMASTQMFGALSSSSNGSGTRVVEQQLAESLSALRDDLRQAMSPARANVAAEELSTLLLEPTIGPTDLDPRDIVEATPWRLTVRAEADAEANASARDLDVEFSTQGAQCVTWSVNRTGWLVRTVRSAHAAGGRSGWRLTGIGVLEPGAVSNGGSMPVPCDGAVLSSRQLLRVAAVNDSTPATFDCATDACLAAHVKPVFSYGTTRSHWNDGPATCDGATTSTIRSTVQGTALNRITSVHAHLTHRARIGSEQGGTYVARDARATIVLRSRTSGTYHEAMQCT